jgi:hypothetical protein
MRHLVAVVLCAAAVIVVAASTVAALRNDNSPRLLRRLDADEPASEAAADGAAIPSRANLRRNNVMDIVTPGAAAPGYWILPAADEPLPNGDPNVEFWMEPSAVVERLPHRGVAAGAGSAGCERR